MASTVTYKGNSIATIANGGSKTLLTQGKYLEGNVIVSDTTATGSLSKGAGSATASGTNVTLGSKATGTPSFPYITVSGSGSVSVGTAGYLAANTSETSNAETANYPITAVNVPKDKAFSVTNVADTAYDNTSTLNITNAAYRRVSVTNSGYVSIYTPETQGYYKTSVEVTNASKDQTNVTVNNRDGYNVTVNSYDQGDAPSFTFESQGGFSYWNSQVTSSVSGDSSLTVGAYNSGTFEGNKPVVSGGQWYTTTVTPSTSQKGPYYGRVIVNAVAAMTLPTAASSTSSGTSKATVTPSTSNQYLNIPTGYNGTASYYTISGDSNLIASNIAQGVTIFGVQGTHQGGGTPSLQAKTATPSASQQVITADTGYDGLSQVTVSGDSDLIAGNIKSGVNIFGVTGSYTGPSYTDGDNLAYGGN